MLEHLIIATDPFFGQDILENAAAGAQLVAEGFNELWQETLNGSLYGSMCKVGQFFFAIATLTLFMVELGKNWINQEDMKALSSWIWPILVIGLLANNGTLLRSGTLAIRGYINTHIPHPNCHKRVFTEYFLDNKSKKILPWLV
jgi:hypothetical protein